MTLSHAHAVAGEVATAPFDPAGDHAALQKLALWAQRFTPAAAVDPPDGLLLDITGCQRLFRGEQSLLSQVVSAIESFGVCVRAAIADTVGAAWAVARAAEERCGIVPPGGQYAALAHLPPWALRISADAVSQLAALGIHRIEALLMLPRAALPSRFGDDVLRRIDQALGRDAEMITPLQPPAPPAAELEFDGGIGNQEVLSAAVRALLDSLAAQLARRGCGVRRIELVIRREGRPPERRCVALCAPNRSARHLAALFEHELERLQQEIMRLQAAGAEAIPLTGIQLIAREIDAMPPEQGRFFEEQSTATAAEAAELFDRLTLRLGAERVIRPEPVESHVPERAWRPAGQHGQPAWHRPQAGWHGPLARAVSGAKANLPIGSTYTAGQRPVPRDAPRDPSPGHDAALLRPLRLLPRPHPMQAMAVVPDQPPIWMRYRGREHRILRGVGPERLCGEWWRDDGDTRDYYQVETEAGARYWVFRNEASGEWFVHGLFD